MPKKKIVYRSKVLKIKYFLSIFLSSATIFLLLGGGIALEEKKRWLDNIQQHETNLILLQKKLFESIFLEHISNAVILADVVRSEISSKDYNKELTMRSLAHLFIAKAEHTQFYDQIRYIDEQGQEIIRVNRENVNKVSLAPSSELQFKGDRYYFKKGSASDQSAYVSQFDLNVENAQIERPFKPMLRITYPVLSQTGEKKGLIVLNLLGQIFIDLLRTTSINSAGQAYLVNNQGCWLKGPSSDVEWLFMFHPAVVNSMASRFPDEWAQISSTDGGHVQSSAGLFTFTQLRPASMVPLLGNERTKIIANESWSLINIVPSKELKPEWWSIAKGILIFGLVAICFLSYFLATLLTRRKIDVWKLADDEMKLNTITDSVYDAIIMVDASGRAFFWNPAAERIFGISAKEIIGNKIQTIILPEEQRATSERHLKLFAKTGVTLFAEKITEIEMLKKDGTRFPATLSLKSVYLDDSWWAVGVIRDITELKEAEDTLRKSREDLEDRVVERTKMLNNTNQQLEDKIIKLKKTEWELKILNLAIEQSPSSVVIMDLDHHIKYVNPSYTRTSGYSREEVLGKNTSILKSNYHAPGFYEDIWHTIGLENMWKGDICNRKKNGELYWEQVTVVAVKNNDDKVTHYVAIKEDIGGQKQKEEALHQAMKKADLANRAKSDFLANMSHEIRTPLNAIIGMSRLVLETPLTDKQQDYLNKIDISVKSLLGVLNDILDFSKIEAGRMKLEETNFSLPALLHRVRDIFSIKVLEKGLQFHLDVAADVPLLLRGDPLRLTQILNNLVGNSIKFTDRGKITLTVKCVNLEEDSAGLQFSVRDTGVGMDKSVKANLFQPFTQADTSTTRKYGGSGLGLAIIKELVGMQGGKIWVESEPGNGSEFSFVIDYALAAREACLIHRRLNDLRLLVVEDEDQIRYMLHKQMAIVGLQLVSTESSAEAIKTIEEQPAHKAFDVYLVDWNLKEETDGIELISKIKNHPKNGKKSKFILMSGYMDQNIQQAIDEGQIDLFLSKPLNSTIVINGLKELFINDGSERGKADQILPQEDVPPHALSGAKILLVEDNEINQQIVVELLHNRGIKVITAGDGQQAIDILMLEEFDAVLMDIQMPVKDGYETTREIRGNTRFDQLPIIAMSAFAMNSDHEKSFEAGMNDFVVKPFQIDDLLAVLTRWVVPQKKRGETTIIDPVSQEHNQDTMIDSDEEDLKTENDIPGIHVEEALNNLEGNATLYHALLGNFSTNFSETAEEIQNAILAKDYPLAHRLAHTIKSVAGNIGAKDLQLSAQNLEKALRKEVIPDCKILLEEFEKSLLVVLTGAQMILDRGED